MVGISSVLSFLGYPALETLLYRIRFDGVNEIIIEWNTGVLGPQPSESDLLTAQASPAYATYINPAEVAKRNEEKNSKVVGRIIGKRKASNEDFTTNSFTNVAGLAFQLAPNTHYLFEYEGAYRTAAAATGIQLSVSGPASPDFISFVGNVFAATNSNIGGVGAAYDSALAMTQSAGATPLPFRLKGTISTGANGGALNLRVRSETVGSTVTILRGTVGTLSASE